MTEYICHECDVKTTLSRRKNATDVPTADECPNCGEVEMFEYL